MTFSIKEYLLSYILNKHIKSLSVFLKGISMNLVFTDLFKGSLKDLIK